jgi:hypothetical protein
MIFHDIDSTIKHRMCLMDSTNFPIENPGAPYRCCAKSRSEATPQPPSIERHLLAVRIAEELWRIGACGLSDPALDLRVSHMDATWSNTGGIRRLGCQIWKKMWKTMRHHGGASEENTAKSMAQHDPHLYPGGSCPRKLVGSMCGCWPFWPSKSWYPDFSKANKACRHVLMPVSRRAFVLL